MEKYSLTMCISAMKSKSDYKDGGDYQHQPVLLEQVCAYAPDNPRFMVDATLGGGGHAKALLQKFPHAKLWGCDCDAQALEASAKVLGDFRERIQLKKLRFSKLSRYLVAGSVAYLVADLGVSSAQLAAGERGFSFQREGPLDMRMDQEQSLRAADFLATASENELRRVFSEFGEERFSKRLASAVWQQRQKSPLLTTGQLVRLIEQVVPKRTHHPSRHVGTRVFQALRIYVNQEMDELKCLLKQALGLLAVRGRLAVISFHSLEDRQVKQAMQQWAHPCTCPSYLPVCVCDRQSRGKILTKRAVFATTEEVGKNPRSRSARLRVFEVD